jgi:catechol 2,3-dioxygenase-like lactoylglutathione lyase family enzyme
MRQNLTCITLGVADFKRSLKFYRDKLGWKTKAMGDVAFFDMHGVIFSIFPTKELAKDAHVHGKASRFRGFSLAINVPSAKEVDAIIKEAKKAGAEIVKEPQKTFWGGYGAYFADPDGHLWEVVHNPFWKLDAKGRVKL